MTDSISIILQLIIGLGILNVWFLRAGKPTPYRGANAGTLKDEFAAYGLPEWAFYLIGGLKVGSALALIAGIWLPVLIVPAASVMAILMLGAAAMHLKVKDPFNRWIPSLFLFACAILLLILPAL